MSRKTDEGTGTTAVHGAARGPRRGPLVEPVALTSTYSAASTQEIDDVYDGRAAGHVYSRYSNPTVDAVAAKLAALEGTDGAVLASSGMAAISLVCLAFAGAGSRIVVQEDVYGGTAAFFRSVAPRLGMRVDSFPTTDARAFEVALDAAPTTLAYLESPTNPTLRLPDVAACAAIARARGVITVIDGTFASPVNSRPHALGADVVVHSATKYLGGHSDLMAGVACADEPLLGRLRALHAITGAILDPHAAFLLDRGLKTLHLRVERSNANAMRLARFIEARPDVRRVHYPGLASHPQHDLARRQMPGGFGGVLAFDLASREAAYRFADALRVVRNAASLGSVESLVSLPVVQSHRAWTDEERARRGIAPGTVRLSVGVEDEADLLADVEQALDCARGLPPG